MQLLETSEGCTEIFSEADGRSGELDEEAIANGVCFEVELQLPCNRTQVAWCQFDNPCLDEAYAPVCGVDEITYANRCAAGNVEIAHEGSCGPVCPAVYEPVCGVDGVTYGNSCEASEVDIAYGGECGGIPNDNLVSCWDLGVLTNDSRIFLSTDRFFDTGGVDSRIYAQFEIYVAVDQTASEIADALAESEAIPTLEAEGLEMVLIKPNGDERPLQVSVTWRPLALTSV